MVFDTKKNISYIQSGLWFRPNSLHSLGIWIVASFENSLGTKYLRRKDSISRLMGGWNLRMSNNYKESLYEFWKGLELAKKKRVN